MLLDRAYRRFADAVGRWYIRVTERKIHYARVL